MRVRWGPSWSLQWTSSPPEKTRRACLPDADADLFDHGPQHQQLELRDADVVSSPNSTHQQCKLHGPAPFHPRPAATRAGPGMIRRRVAEDALIRPLGQGGQHRRFCSGSLKIVSQPGRYWRDPPAGAWAAKARWTSHAAVTRSPHQQRWAPASAADHRLTRVEEMKRASGGLMRSAA